MPKTNIDPVDRGATDASSAYVAVPALQASWAATGGAYQAPQYAKDTDGNVVFRGTITGGTVAATTLIFTLPVGFRPAFKEVFPANANTAAGTAGVVTVDANGEVRVGALAWVAVAIVTLNTIKFVAVG